MSRKKQDEREKRKAAKKLQKKKLNEQRKVSRSMTWLGVDLFALSHLGSRIHPLYKMRRCNVCGEYVTEDLATHEAFCKGNHEGKKTGLFKAIRKALWVSGAYD